MVAVRATGDVTGGAGPSRRAGLHPVLGAVIGVLGLAHVLLVLGTVVGLPLVGVLGLLPVLVLDVVVVVVAVLLTRRLDPPAASTLLPRTHPGVARVASGLIVTAALAAVAGDSFLALLAAPVGVFALVMALFPTTAVWWRWCGRAAAVSVLAWPAPVLAGMRLDRDAIEAYGVGFGMLVTVALAGLTVALATVAAVGYAVDGPSVTAPDPGRG